MNYELEKIINVANELLATGRTGASTGELIAAVFALDQMDYLPSGYTVVEAWERLDTRWQGYVKQIHNQYQHLLNLH